MEKFNTLQKMDQEGRIYRGVVFSAPIIVIGSEGPRRRSNGVLSMGNADENKKRAIRKAKSSIRDYVKTNLDLKYFVTYTLDASKIDRYDSKVIYEKMRHWLSNAVKRKGFKYILIPEKHKDGAWHFHGFTNVPVKWKYGFSEEKEVRGARSRDKQINYVLSYVKKDMEMFNCRYYLHSQNLEKPKKIYKNTDFEKAEGYCMELEGMDVRVKVQG